MAGFAQLSHTILDSDKAWSVLDKDPQAFALWVMAIAYCSRSETDGILNSRAQRFLGMTEHQVATLVEAGLLDWDEQTGTLSVHDYLDWNNSRSQIQASRDRARQRQAKRRRNVTGDVTANVTRDVTRDVTRESRLQDKDKDKDKDKDQDKSQDQVKGTLIINDNLIDTREPDTQTAIESWHPTPELDNLAKELGFNPLSEAAKFRYRIMQRGTKTQNLNSAYESWLRTGAAKGYMPLR